MYKSKNHSKYSLKAHLVFVVKYRKKLLNPEIDFFVKQKFLQIAERSDFEIELMESDKDHIHLLIDYEPKVSILQIVRRLKQESTIDLWRVHENELKKHFWKERTFGQMDILHVVLEKEQAMRLYNSTLRVKDSGAHSWSKLKTCTFSEQEKNK